MQKTKSIVLDLKDGKTHRVFILDDRKSTVLVSVDGIRNYFGESECRPFRHRSGGLTPEGIFYLANRVVFGRESAELEVEEIRWDHEEGSDRGLL